MLIAVIMIKRCLHEEVVLKRKLNLLISTINERILGLENIISHRDDVIFTVSHQVTDELNKEVIAYIDKLKNSHNVIYSEINSIGVAKNRNNALNHRVKGSICLLCDDDVIYFEDSFDTLISTFNDDPTIEFLTFKIKTFSGKDYKKYSDEAYRHTVRSLSNIGIIDVAFKEEVIDKYNLNFDERFGPGGQYAIGEDFIFMMDALKRKANIYYKPLAIVQHDEIGTGQRLRDDIILGRGAMFTRVFGVAGFILNIYFSLKNRKKYNSVYTFWQYNKLLFIGSINYIRGKN